MSETTPRGRKPATPMVPAGPDYIGHTHPADAEPIERMNAAVSHYSDERDLVNQMMGQAQALHAVSKLTTVVSLTKLAHIKESKIYKSLAGKELFVDGENRRLVGTWDECCELLGMSRSKVDEDLTNLAAFGEDALDGLTRIGAGYRELRKLRRLPEDERLAIARAPDKETLLELIDDLATKHATEKAKLEVDLKAASETLEIRDRQIKAKDEKINELDAALAKPAPEYAQAAALDALDRQTLLIVASIQAAQRKAVLDVMGEGSLYDLPRAARQQIGAAMGRIVLAVRDVAAALDLEINESTKQDADPDDAIWKQMGAQLAAQNVAAGHVDAA